MSTNKLKIVLAAFIVLPLLGSAVYRSGGVQTVNASDDDPVSVYKTKCAMCHKTDASRYFDVEKPDEHHVNAILKGQKREKPPYMPGYEKKGMSQAQAEALVSHMRTLAPAPDPDANSDTRF